jgi:hypothetical protein
MVTAFFLGCSSSTLSESRDYIVLGSETLHNVLKQCSRPTPDSNKSWIPSESDIAFLETSLDKLHNLKAKGCCIRGARVVSPRNFYRQYFGLLVSQRSLIYINAFSWAPEKWKIEAVSICDGGELNWGVLFDPKTGRFLNLAFNGLS